MASSDEVSNGPATKMYRLNPLYEPTEQMELPTSMYKLDSIYRQDEEQPIKQFPADSANMSVIKDLEIRQDKVLLQIQKLQNQVKALMENQNVSVTRKTHGVESTKKLPSVSNSQAPPPRTTAAPGAVLGSSLTTLAPTTGPTAGKTVEELVISASPSNPPLSLLVLRELLSKQSSLFFSSYVHSSAKAVNATHLRDILGSPKSVPSNRNAYQFGFTIIWKEEKYSPVLRVDPCQQTPIVGEANIARYLARIISPSYDAGDVVTSTQIDALVDLADGQFSKDVTQKANFMKTISSCLGKSRWMLGENLTLADIVLWSAVHQSKQDNRAPDNVKRWIELCNQHPDFAIAKQLV